MKAILFAEQPSNIVVYQQRRFKRDSFKRNYCINTTATYHFIACKRSNITDEMFITRQTMFSSVSPVEASLFWLYVDSYNVLNITRIESFIYPAGWNNLQYFKQVDVLLRKQERK